LISLQELSQYKKEIVFIHKFLNTAGAVMTKFAILFFSLFLVFNASGSDVSSTIQAKRHQNKALDKFAANPVYCNLMLDDRNSGDALPAGFSKGLNAALNETGKSAQAGINEIRSICEKKISAMDLAQVLQVKKQAAAGK
jgi:hypothetical protein